MYVLGVLSRKKAIKVTVNWVKKILGKICNRAIMCNAKVSNC